MRTWEIIAKRALDITVSLLALICLSPEMLMIALWVRMTSPGPSFFYQKRVGKNGKPFTFIKFRTMYETAPDLRNQDGSTYNREDDPRVTRVGRFLRKTSLDELPQFINVLRGEMTLVGPRPDILDQLQHYTVEERRRFLVKPGLTGLAQVKGRKRLSWNERTRLDLAYVDTQSFLLDLRILIATLPNVLNQRDVFTPYTRV